MNYEAECSTANELFEAIDRLPDTIKSIKIPLTLDYVSAAHATLTPKTSGWREVVKDILSDTLNCDKGSNVDEFNLKSYFISAKGTEPFYVEFRSPGLRSFANAMASGEYGALD